MLKYCAIATANSKFLYTIRPTPWAAVSGNKSLHIRPCPVIARKLSTNFNPSFDNEPNTYRKLKRIIAVEKERRLNSSDRFLPISKREDRCDQPIQVCKANSKGRYIVAYRGCTIIKNAEELQVYHQLFWDLRPQTVIEVGVAGGGSAVWFADQLKLLDIPGHVYSMDIDLSLIEENVKKINPTNITFLQGNCNEIEKTFTPDMLSKLPRPWLLVEDAHVNMDGVFKYFHQFLKEGDYLTVEDTNPYIPRDVGYMGTAFDSTTFLGRAKLDAFKKFLMEHEDYYAVDGFLTDLFGYNCSWMWHGFVRRMK